MISVVVVLAASSALIGRAETADALTYKSYSTYLAQVRPVLAQWHPALENFRGHHFLTAPDASNTAGAPQLQALLNQWWGGLENEHGSHFLTQPTVAATDSTADLHALLNQWQNAMEAWRGSHFLLEPPGALTVALTKTGNFSLKPNTPTVAVGERANYEIGWKVPQPNNWHDLKTIDFRVCSHDTVLLVRWRELENTLALLNPKNGHALDIGEIGSRGSISSPAAKLNLRSSSVAGNGETGRKVTLSLDLAFQRPAEGVECDLMLAAADDLGNRDPFKLAGKIRIR